MSPEVWNDARPRIEAAATTLGLTIAWPNERFEKPEPIAAWLDVELSANASEPIELTGGVWQETGSLWLHIMIPTFKGITDGLVLRKGMSNAFRSVADAGLGIVYRGDNGNPSQEFDPLGPGTDDGVYRRLTAVIHYVFQDRPA